MKTLLLDRRVYPPDLICEIAKADGFDLRQAFVDDQTCWRDAWEIFEDDLSYEARQLEVTVFIEKLFGTLEPFDFIDNTQISPLFSDNWGYIMWVGRCTPDKGFNLETLEAFSSDAAHYKERYVPLHHNNVEYQTWLVATGLRNCLINYEYYRRWLSGKDAYRQRQVWSPERLVAMERHLYDPDMMSDFHIQDPYQYSTAEYAYDVLTYANKDFHIVTKQYARELVDRGEMIYALALWWHHASSDDGYCLIEIPANTVSTAKVKTDA